MSNFHHSPSHPQPGTPTIATLALSLQETAQALLRLSSINQEDTCRVNTTGPPQPERTGEKRSFYFPPASLHMERELFCKYRVPDFQGLLEQAHILLVGLIKLMQSVPKDMRVRGQVIISLGAQIEHVAALLLRMRNTYEKVLPLERGKDGG